jgi:hypothetical protein
MPSQTNQLVVVGWFLPRVPVWRHPHLTVRVQGQVDRPRRITSCDEVGDGTRLGFGESRWSAMDVRARICAAT